MTKKVMLVSPVWRKSTVPARERCRDLEEMCREFRQGEIAAAKEGLWKGGGLPGTRPWHQGCKVVEKQTFFIAEATMAKIQYHLLVNILPVSFLLILMAIGMVYVNLLIT